MHTWNSLLMKDTPYHYGKDWSDKRIAKEDTDRYLKLYNPSSFIVEKPKEYHSLSHLFDRSNTIKSNYAGGYDSDEAWPHHINGIFCMWDSISSHQKIFNPEDYDYLLFCRSDTGLIRFDVNELSPHSINSESLDREGLINNMFFVVPGKYANSFMNIRYNLEQYFHDLGQIWCSERFMDHWRAINNLTNQFCSWGLSIQSFRM